MADCAPVLDVTAHSLDRVIQIIVGQETWSAQGAAEP